MAKKEDAAPDLSPHAAEAARHRTQLPEGWETRFASEAAALAAYDSSAPASIPGMTKLEADGPSIHAMQAGAAPASFPQGGNAPGQEAYFKAADQEAKAAAKSAGDTPATTASGSTVTPGTAELDPSRNG